MFRHPDVVSASTSFARLRVDLTRRLPDQDLLLAHYGIRGVPTVIFLNRQGVEERNVRVESYVGPRVMLERMQKVLDPD